jgi:uncharacterized protein YPO0396
MKWMRKLRLINWHYYQDETMEFGKQTLITGQNAAGKSTIIDALQVIFIADQRQIRFNPAAHEETKRSMLNYLRGKIGSDEQSYLRNGDFTTYIAAEFWDDDRKEAFVVGVAVDVPRDHQYQEQYFILAETSLDELEFVKPSGHLRTREEFKRWHTNGTSSFGRRRAIFEQNKSLYQKALLARFGNLRERFFPIFQKALSFKPIHNVRDFVYEYIMEKRELQINLMKENFDIYERYNMELEMLQERKDKLQEIQAKYEQYDKLRATIGEQEYVIRRLRVVLEEEQLESLRQDVTRINEELRKLADELAFARTKYEEARDEAERAFTRLTHHDDRRRKDELEAEISDLQRLERRLLTDLSETYRALEEERALITRLAGWEGNEK